MAVWTPDMPWPSPTTGGVAAPAWGGYTRLWVRAGIAAGRPFHMGPHPNDRLDAGNVLAGGEIDPGGGFLGDRLWIDMSCDVLSVECEGGATSGQGIFGKVDATTLTVRIADPEGIYDPLYRGGPFAYGGRSRLVPGVPVEVFAEVVNGDTGTWTTQAIFTGTADSWAEDWVPHPWKREALLVATDATKTWARYNAEEQAPVGQGETVGQRIQRLVSFFGWPGVIDAPAGGSPRTLDATTLAQAGWEMLNRTLDDELGAVYFTPAGHLRWINREANTTIAAARLRLGCGRVDVAAHNVLIDASPAKFDLQLRNDVYAANSGSTQQHAFSASSIDAYGPYPYRRTDLGLATDPQAADWAVFVVQLYAFPQVGIEDLTLVPALDPKPWTVWSPVLGWQLFTDIALIAWAPPDHPEHVVVGEVRVVGVKHTIDRFAWEVEWQTIAARPVSLAGATFHMGPHANDRLDAGFVLA